MRISASFYTVVWCISCSAAQFLFRLICRNLTIGGKLSSSAIHLAAHSLDPGLWLTFGSPAISQARQRSSWSAFAVCHLMIRAAASPTSSGSVGCGAIPVIMAEDLAPKAYFGGGGLERTRPRYSRNQRSSMSADFGRSELLSCADRPDPDLGDHLSFSYRRRVVARYGCSESLEHLGHGGNSVQIQDLHLHLDAKLDHLSNRVPQFGRDGEYDVLSACAGFGPLGNSMSRHLSRLSHGEVRA